MINAIFDGSYNSVTASNAYLHDYGQKLRILGLSLPAAVEAHFAADESGDSVLRAGASSDGVTLIPIPDSCLEEAGSFYCYIFDRDVSGGKTVYKIKVPVLKRADLPSATTDPSEDDSNYFAQVITEVTAQAEAAAASATEAEEAKDELLTGISIGTVETLSAGSEATASFTETEDGVALNLGIPQGETGETGGVGEDVSGQTFTVDNVEVTADNGAERFNDYVYNIASGACSHAEGGATTATGAYSHAEGLNTKVLSTYGHAEGVATVASGEAAHAEGKGATASNETAHAEGYGTIASGARSHAEGWGCNALEQNSHAEGQGTTASGINSHSEGGDTTASGSHSHAEGSGTTASGSSSHAEGMGTVASGAYSRAEGEYTTASGETAHSEGYHTEARGAYSHAEGEESKTGGYAQAAHAEGYYCEATGRNSHAEGSGSVASKQAAHAEGGQTTASGVGSHSEGMSSTASAEAAHAEGINTIAASKYQHAQGKYNVEDSANKYAHIVGIGTSSARANGHTMDWNGVCWYAGDVRCGGTDQDAAAVSLIDLATRLATLEAAINNG